jgi:hypothetical protein
VARLTFECVVLILNSVIKEQMAKVLTLCNNPDFDKLGVNMYNGSFNH